MKPILFNTEMVASILQGIKTQTRRPMKFDNKHRYSNNWHVENKIAHSPYQIGDVLYVRETWNRIDQWDIDRADYVFEKCVYKANEKDCYEYPEISWRPSIHMPREFARLFLEITDVRAERVQSISENDAKTEGFTKSGGWFPDYTNYERSYRHAFAWGWNTIYHDWDANPWVFAYTFKVIDKPEATE